MGKPGDPNGLGAGVVASSGAVPSTGSVPIAHTPPCSSEGDKERASAVPSPVPHVSRGIPGTVPAAAERGAQAGIGAEAGPAPPLPGAAPACQGAAWGHPLAPGHPVPTHTPASLQALRGLEGQRLGGSTAKMPPLLRAGAGGRLSAFTLVFSQVLPHDAVDIVFLPFCLRPAARPAALGGFAAASLPVPSLGPRLALDAVGAPGGEEGARG